MHSHHPMETNATSIPNEGRHGRSTAPKTRRRRTDGALRTLAIAVLAFAAILTGLLPDGTASAQKVNDNGSATIYTSTLTMASSSAPQNLSAKAISSTQIDLEWEAPAMTGGPAFTGYKIEMSTNAGNNWSDLAADTTSTDTTYSHMGLMSGDTRHYRVSAINTDGTGPVSNIASTTIAVPTAPRNLNATAGNGQVTLTWDPPSDDRANSITKYQARHEQGSSVSEGVNWTDVDGGADARTHTVNGLNNGSEYAFEVSAVNVIGDGTAATVKATPFQPTRAITYGMYVTNYSITRGSTVTGDQKTPVVVYAYNTTVETDTTFTLTWNDRPTNELHPDNPTSLTIKAGQHNASGFLSAAPDDDNPKVYNQPVKANVVATLGSLALSDQLVVIDDEWLPTASFSTPDTVREGQAFRITANLSFGLDVDTYVIGRVENPSEMNLQGFDEPYIYLSIPAGSLSAESGDIRKRNDNEEDGYGDLYISVNNSNLKHWWPEDERHKVHVTDDDTTDPNKRRYAGWPRLIMGDANATESGDPNTETTITFTVFLYPTSRSTITVDYRTQDDSAKAGVNYRATSGTLTFAPREKHKTIEIDVFNDGQGPSTSFRLIATGPHGGGAEVRDYWVTGRIYDESPTFRSWHESARESGNGEDTQMNFYVSLHHGDDNRTYTIDYSTVDGTAKAGSDYTATSGTLTFAPSDKSYKQVTVPILDDSVDDSGEQFSLVLSNPTGGAQLNRWYYNVKGTIFNEDAPGVSANFPSDTHTSGSHTGTDDRPKVVVAFSEAVASFNKDTPSVNAANATITSVQSHTEDGIANAYIFTLDPTGDDDITFALLSNADCDSGGICTSSGIKLIETPTMLTITGPKPPTVASQLSVGETTASEEDDSTIDFVVKLDPASDETVTVNYATANGTATAGGDYTAKNGSLTFNAGDTSKTVQVSIIDDSIDDNNETLTLTLSGASGADISDRQATGTITNNEPDPLAARYINMPNEHDGSTAFGFAVEFSHDVEVTPDHMRDYSFTVTDGDVTAASKISGLSYLWEVTVEPDSNNDVTITLARNRDCSTAGAICKDADPRQLSNSLTATIPGPDSRPDDSTADETSAKETTTDDATTSQLSVADAAASEENDSTVDFVVTLNPANDDGVSVDYATSNGTATAGEDYTAQNGTLTFNAGDTTKTIQVPITDDTIDEDNETITLTISNASGADISDATATGTITNNEPVPLTASFTNAPATHSGSGIFTFDLLFSENIKAGYKRIRDQAFTVTGGEITKAKRKDQGSNQTWTITVEPDDNGAVSITLPATTDCDVDGAICTYDKRMLSNSTSVTISGPQ